MAQGPATEQPSSVMSAQTKVEPATQQRAASSSRYATEQPSSEPGVLTEIAIVDPKHILTFENGSHNQLRGMLQSNPRQRRGI